MTRNSGNQIRAKKIQSHALTDPAKLAELETYLRMAYPKWVIIPQAYLTFSKGEEEFQYAARSLTEREVAEFAVSHPDLYILRENGKRLILELDGDWHDKHVEKTEKRNMRYDLNDIQCVVVNETDLKFKLRPGIRPKSWHLTGHQIVLEFAERITEALRNA